MNFFWVNEKIFLVVCFFQFVYAYIISDHLPFDVAENVFCCGQFFHVLVGKIADVTGNSKVYIKNKLIAEYGQYETINGALVPLPLDDDIDAYNVEFIHLQPTSRTTTNQKGKVFRVNLVMRGSHTYDTDEMSKLIDGTVSEAKDLGIETLTPNQIREMKERWGAKVEKETVERVHG